MEDSIPELPVEHRRLRSVEVTLEACLREEPNEVGLTHPLRSGGFSFAKLLECLDKKTIESQDGEPSKRSLLKTSDYVEEPTANAVFKDLYCFFPVALCFECQSSPMLNAVLGRYSR